MKPRTMHFSRDWRKLDDRMFATIRVHRGGDLKFAPDETVAVASPEVKFRARALLACNWKFKGLPFSLLDYDLEAAPGETRRALVNRLGRLYKSSEQPKPEDTVTVYFMEKLLSAAGTTSAPRGAHRRAGRLTRTPQAGYIAPGSA
ncbi:MAG: hypothetical protein JSV90_00925 [Methanobacteriota archaeon]|nr:MAG: hypothetical protein JSV90_00925 [Euryarchaeota archaeon]